MLKRIYAFFAGYYNFLLIFLLLIFMFRPYDRGIAYLAGWKLCLTLVFLSAIYTLSDHIKVRTVALCLAIPSILLTWINLLYPKTYFFIGESVFTVFFMTLSSLTIIYDVLMRARVTVETLKGVICAYFMVAFAFGYLYYLVEYIFPHSFSISKNISILQQPNFLSEMLYYSFGTLLTIGFGDVVAIRDVGQTVSILEGMVGQFYIAILVARLVAVYSIKKS